MLLLSRACYSEPPCRHTFTLFQGRKKATTHYCYKLHTLTMPPLRPPLGSLRTRDAQVPPQVDEVAPKKDSAPKSLRGNEMKQRCNII